MHVLLVRVRSGAQTGNRKEKRLNLSKNISKAGVFTIKACYIVNSHTVLQQLITTFVPETQLKKCS